LSAVLDAWLKANEGDAGKSFYRVPLRLRWIDGVLAPVAADLDEASRRRLEEGG
jgi:hypothetical protein